MKETATKKPVSKARALWGKIAFFFYVLALVVATCFSSFVWFQKTYFTAYWVNGQSMWPTLNKETRTASGELFNEDPRKPMVNATGIDYIIGDEHPNVLNKLKRFDIVICKYTPTDTYEKIKRIIALPGETFYIDSTSIGDAGNGVVHLLNKETNEYEILEQPLETKYVAAGEYPKTYTEPFTLGDDEYFVLGDNRLHSSDSRANGPVKYSEINAKAIALVARCKATLKSGSTTLEATNVSYMWPRFL